jgi:hypothetical protein
MYRKIKEKYRKGAVKMKKILSLICALAMMVVMAVPLTVNAASYGPTWTKESNGDWTYQGENGTSLIARIDEDTYTLYIKGTGDVPSYSKGNLGNRPWNGKYITEIVIEKGITSIGEDAFSNMSELKRVTMPVSIYIEDVSAFDGEPTECVFEFTGMNIVNRDTTAAVPYTSLDSIVELMKKYQYDYQFVVNNYYMVSMITNNVGYRLDNLRPSDVVSTDYNPDYPLYDFKSTGNVVNENGNSIRGVNVTSRRQGETVNYIYSLVMGDMNYVTSYNISAYNSSGAIGRTTTPVQYSITIPKAFQYPGRQFYLIQIGTGEVNILSDEDLDDATLTFTTDYGTTVYALCYTDI